MTTASLFLFSRQLVIVVLSEDQSISVHIINNFMLVCSHTLDFVCDGDTPLRHLSLGLIDVLDSYCETTHAFLPRRHGFCQFEAVQRRPRERNPGPIRR